jgi:thioredoxin 1
MAKGILEIDDGSFDDEVLQADKPVMVDFWAPWCGPCRAIGPVIEELAGAFDEKVKFTKCNVDDNPVTPGKFGIKSIPTLIFFKEGKVAEQIVGIVAKSKLEDILNKLV